MSTLPGHFQSDYMAFAPAEDLKVAIDAVNPLVFLAEDAEVLNWGKEAVALFLKENNPTPRDGNEDSTEDASSKSET